MSRRGFVAGAGAVLSGCATRRSAVGPPAARPHLARVQVAADRVIRTLVAGFALPAGTAH